MLSIAEVAAVVSMTNLKLPLEGGCQCGQVRYRITTQPLTLYACHCRDCQKQSSSAFGLSLWVERRAFELTRGALQQWTAIADSGDEKHCTFCGNCGSRIYHAFGDGDEPLSLKAGSLDETELLEPIGHIWTCRAHNWLELHRSGKPCYDREPESFDDLLKAWRSS